MSKWYRVQLDKTLRTTEYIMVPDYVEDYEASDYVEDQLNSLPGDHEASIVDPWQAWDVEEVPYDAVPENLRA